MQVLRAGELPPAAGAMPVEGLSATWLCGPTQNADLDVGLIFFEAGAALPPHIHLGGQVLVVTSGQGFVEVDGERTEIGPGDVVITPAGELHTHGASPNGPIVHLAVTTGGIELPQD